MSVYLGGEMAKKTKQKGNVPEGDTRLAVNVDKKLHKKLKMAADR